jgi:hypothetical protein
MEKLSKRLNSVKSLEPDCEYIDATSGLNARDIKLADHYLMCGDYIAAAEYAGYKNPTRKDAFTLISRPKIRTYMDWRLKSLIEKNDEKILRVISRLFDIAFSDISEFIGPDNKIKDLSKCKGTKNIKRIHASSTGSGYTNMHIEMYDAEAALRLLGKYLGIFRDRLDVQLRSCDQPINITFEKVTGTRVEDDLPTTIVELIKSKPVKVIESQPIEVIENAHDPQI